MVQSAIFEPGLYAILDLDTVGSRDPRAVARALLDGGCVALQLRAKGRPRETFRALAGSLRQDTREAGVPYFINDDAELAAEVGADGVHLGQEDGTLTDAGRHLHPGQVVGRSTHDPSQVRRAAATAVAYLGYGPVFPTGTKADADPVVGLRGLTETCAAVALPVVAIGGITLHHASALARAGAHAGAAISSILNAPDIAAAVGAFNDAFCAARTS